MTPPTPPVEYLSEHGRPIGYGYLTGQYPLADYQTVYARQPGSAEMVSASRPRGWVDLVDAAYTAAVQRRYLWH